MQTIFCALLYPQEIRRVDMYVSALFADTSRSYIQKILEKWLIKINGKIASKWDRIRNKDLIEVIFETDKSHIEAEDIPVDIIFENEDFAIINKDAWINVHPVPWFGWNSWTLVNALLYHMDWLSVIWWVERPWIVHRLDKDTSGILIIAKSDRSMHTIQVAMNKRQVKKTYIALVVGKIKETDWYIESYIWRDQFDRKKMTSINPINPKLAKTKFKVLEYIENKYSLVEVDLLTWRTHQIRVHFSSIWYPLVWDKVYWIEKVNKEFIEKFSLSRQFLHAWKIGFELFWMKYSFEAPLKHDLLQILDNFNIKI